MNTFTFQTVGIKRRLMKNSVGDDSMIAEFDLLRLEERLSWRCAAADVSFGHCASENNSSGDIISSIIMSRV